MPYHQVVCLGSGFFGEVWLEHDAGLNRSCAAKYLDAARLPPGTEFDEARAMLDAQHDNVVQVYSADLEAGQPVIRMEYLPAGSVAARYRGEPAPVAEAMHVVEEACRGVEALHTRGVLHRDLKPANLLVGDDGRIKVSDFGLACQTTNVAGAPPWGYREHLPPEALAGTGAIDTAPGDVYALGVTLYRLLNGDDMMRAVAAGADVTDLIKRGKYPDRGKWQPHVHDRLRRVVRKAMHVDLARRYGSATELRHALETARPVVSWVPVAVAGAGLAWEGITDSAHYRARLSPNRRREYVFSLERQRAAGQFRASGSDALITTSARQAMARAATVLQRVAATGR